MSTLLLMKVIAGLFLGGLVASVVLMPLVMRFARMIDAVDRGGYRKVFEGAMPLLGGLGVALPLMGLGTIATVVGYWVVENWVWVEHHYPNQFGLIYSIAEYREECAVLTIGGLAILALGIVDDTRGMRARWKLLGQVTVAAFVCISGHALSSISVPGMGSIDLGLVMGGLVTIFWIVGMINAFNLIDGVDGLASGIALVGVTALVVLSVIQENIYVTLVGSVLAGTLLGFLCYNFPPARIFLGDTGSMFIGFFLASVSLMGVQKYETAVILLAPTLALSFPIFETLISIARRYLRGVPIFVGDNHHTHHRLLGKGYSQPRVVLTLYGVAVSLATAAVLSSLIPTGSIFWGLPYGLYAGTLVYIAWLAGYLRPTAFRAIFERRQKNRLFHALANYAKQCLDCHGHCVERRLLLELCRHELGLRYIEVHLENTARLMASDGVPADFGPEKAEETLRVKSFDDQNVFIYFAYNTAPEESHRQDIIACLAGIFDQTILDHEANRLEIQVAAAESSKQSATPERGMPITERGSVPER